MWMWTWMWGCVCGRLSACQGYNNIQKQQLLLLLLLLPPLDLQLKLGSVTKAVTTAASVGGGGNKSRCWHAAYYLCILITSRRTPLPQTMADAQQNGRRLMRQLAVASAVGPAAPTEAHKVRDSSCSRQSNRCFGFKNDKQQVQITLWRLWHQQIPCKEGRKST